MNFIVDIVILGILAGCIAWGYHKGLTESLLKILSFVLAVVIAFVLFKPVSNFVIDNTDWDESLEKTIREIIVKDNKNKETEEKQRVEKSEEQNIPDVMMNYIDETIKKAGNDAKEAIADSISKDMAITIINTAVGVGVFIIARIILFFLRGVLKLITKLPVIEQFDKAGGVIYGILEALVIIYVVLAILSFISPMLDSTGIISSIKNSFIGSMMYNHNILLEIIF